MTIMRRRHGGVMRRQHRSHKTIRILSADCRLYLETIISGLEMRRKQGETS
jgi:hypothetical protein